MRAALTFALLIAQTALLGASPALADDASDVEDFVLRGCTVITCAGDDIADGAVVVRDGKIAAVGTAADVETPVGVREIDASGKFVMPAFVHVSSRLGMNGNGGGGSTAANGDRTAAHELNPWRADYLWVAANGFGTLGLQPGSGIIGGRGVGVRSLSDSVDSMLRNEHAFVRVDVAPGARFVSTLAGKLAGARKEMDAMAAYEIAHAKWEAEKAKAEAAKKPVPKEPPKPKQASANEAYRDVLDGRTTLLCRLADASDVGALAKALDERVRGEKMKLVVQIGGDSYRAAAELADLGATCVVSVAPTTWPNTDHIVSPAVILRNAGLPVVLQPRGASRGAFRAYRFELANVVEAGFDRGAALAAATVEAARVLGMEDEVGTIEEGRRADLVLCDGDPLLATTHIEHVWLDGELIEETP